MHSAAILAVAFACASAHGGDIETWTMPKDDAVIRRTDSCNCGSLLPGTGTPGQGQGLPDLVEVSLCGWDPGSAEANLYSGVVVDQDSTADFFRMEVVFHGLVNPPGTLGVGAGTAYNPFQFGFNPVYGFIEVDVDKDRDTGGETPSVAALRYLGNAARFGGRPRGAIGPRAAVTGDDLNQVWTNTPQVCRSGADWVLAFCGCFPVTVVSTSVPGDVFFSSGDTWIVQGRFWQRAGGYQLASSMVGGSAPGLYDQPVKLQFSHNPTTNETTVTLVGALTQAGAAQMAGHPVQPLDTSAANQTSIQEGVQDLINRAQNLTGITGLPRELVQRWSNKSFNHVKRPTEWRVSALVGTTPCSPSDGLYIWTDIGFGVERGDVNGDGTVCNADRAMVQAYIATNDGSFDRDNDSINGQVSVPNFGTSFVLYDIDGDGVVGPQDVAFYNTLPPPCAADFDGSGSATIADIFAYLNAWFTGSPSANVDNQPGTTIGDIFFFLNLWFSGCP